MLNNAGERASKVEWEVAVLLVGVESLLSVLPPIEFLSAIVGELFCMK